MPPIDHTKLESELTSRIIRAFYNVYNDLGYGLPERVYANALSVELQLMGLAVSAEVVCEVVYKGVVVGICRFDRVVENRVLVETKASKTLVEADKQQILSYLKASVCEVGLLLHFGPTPTPHRYILTNDRK